MLKGTTGNITPEVGRISKAFDNPPQPIFYSLSKELLDTVTELELLEKKINLGDDLLAKVKDQALISKLEKEKKGFKTQKINLGILIKKLEYINGSIKDFTLFFIFIRRFYTLAIKKENFERRDKNISSKLIVNLKKEEEDLYNEYIDGDCFTKVFLALAFEPYQCYFKNYAKNFFDNIQHSSDSYVNSLLILKAIFYECTHFNTDNFNLTNLKFFLSKNIPSNISLPDLNYELVALRCFFFYELLLDYLKLTPVKTNLDQLKKSVNLELSIVNYKSNINNTLIYGLNDLQEALNKIGKKHNDFLGRKPDKDKETDINNALVFYKVIEDEVQAINKKVKNLIDNKYLNLTKMRRLLAIIINEAHFPKFLEVFNIKLGNDFFLNEIGKLKLIETNKQALNHLFHAIYRDEFYTPLNIRINSFISELTETYPKDDTSILDSIEMEDLIEFSFYYIFTLLYTDFNAGLKGLNNKLLYTELIAFNRFINIKLEALEILEKRKNAEVNKFFENIFKNTEEYNRHKKNTLEEIKLNREVIQDIMYLVSNAKTLESTLTPKVSSLVPMPEKNALIASLNELKAKQKVCESDFKKIEKHEFISKTKLQRTSKANKAYSKKDSEIKFFSKILGCLSENLSESLKTIKENLHDINQCYEKIYSSKDQITSSIHMLSSSLSSCKNSKETLSLSKLLKKSEDLVKSTLITGEDYQENLDKIQELINSSSSFSLINFFIAQFNLIDDKYNTCNYKANEIFKGLSTPIENHKKFEELKSEEKKYEIIKKILDDDYESLKKQSKSLKKLISLFKCDTDARVTPLYKKIKAKDDEYQATYCLLKEKITKLLCIIKKKSENNNDKKVTLLARQEGVCNRFTLMSEAESASPCKVIVAEGGSMNPVRNGYTAWRPNNSRTNLCKRSGFFEQTLPPIKEEDAEKTEKNLSEQQSEKFVPSIEKFLCSKSTYTDESTEHCLLTEILKSTDECNKLKTRKERAKAALKEIISESKYNFFMERIDPFNVSTSTPAIETNADSNPATMQADAIEANTYSYPQSGPPATCSYVPEVAFYPPVVVDTYRLESSVVVNTYRLESRVVYPS